MIDPNLAQPEDKPAQRAWSDKEREEFEPFFRQLTDEARKELYWKRKTERKEAE